MQLHNIQEFFSASYLVTYLPTGAFWITGLKIWLSQSAEDGLHPYRLMGDICQE
jgi:hypothetical protein